MKIHRLITAGRVMAALEADEYVGFCNACGGTDYGVEPDARGYECPDCGEHQVNGAEEYLFMGVE